MGRIIIFDSVCISKQQTKFLKMNSFYVIYDYNHPQWARTEYRTSWYSSEVGRMMNSHLLVVFNVSNLCTTAWWRRCDVEWNQAEFVVVETCRKTQNNNKMIKKIQLWKSFDFYVMQKQINDDAYNMKFIYKTHLKWCEK